VPLPDVGVGSGVGVGEPVGVGEAVGVVEGDADAVLCTPDGASRIIAEKPEAAPDNVELSETEAVDEST